MPPTTIAGRALIAVVAIMTFLASLTIGAVVLIHAAASQWQSDVAREITIQIRPAPGRDLDTDVVKAAAITAAFAGIAEVRPYSKEESLRLLEPWLGQTGALAALPIPRLIAVEIDRSNPPDIQLIKTALSQNFEGVTLDDHRRWQAEIRMLTRSAALGGGGVTPASASALSWRSAASPRAAGACSHSAWKTRAASFWSPAASNASPSA